MAKQIATIRSGIVRKLVKKLGLEEEMIERIEIVMEAGSVVRLQVTRVIEEEVLEEIVEGMVGEEAEWEMIVGEGSDSWAMMEEAEEGGH
ncbi:MAG: hypothetical protein EBZ53_03670 [Verrucomicrobia bacterium]|nr:hypothetical protein [Verrucomicrobiota bacterium]